MDFGDFYSAHLTWFVPPGELAAGEFPELFAGVNYHNLPLMAVGVLGLGLAIFLHGFMRKKVWGDKIKQKLARFSIYNVGLVRMLLATALILSMRAGNLFGPDIHMADGADMRSGLIFEMMGSDPVMLRNGIFLGIELMAGVCLLLGVLPQLMAVSVIGLWLAMAALSVLLGPAGLALNYIHILGAALYILFAGHTERISFQGGEVRKFFTRVFARLAPYGSSIFRISCGLSLIAVAFHEKLLNPYYGLTFLENYSYFNFLREFGMSDAVFLFCAALVEVYVGVLLVMGLIPRLAALVLLGLFTTTFAILGGPELIGHLVFIGLIFVLLAEGATQKIGLLRERD